MDGCGGAIVSFAFKCELESKHNQERENTTIAHTPGTHARTHVPVVRMVDVEEVDDVDSHDGPSSRGSDVGDSGGVSAGGEPPMQFTDDFQKLLQLASHLKSAQPEVREKRQRWERLSFFQKNTLLFQEPDAKLRYGPWLTKEDGGDGDDGDEKKKSILEHDEQCYSQSLKWKTEAGELFKLGQYPSASTFYQRIIGLYQWSRKFQTKDGDEIEWYDRLAGSDTSSVPPPPSSSAPTPPPSPLTLSIVSDKKVPLNLVLPPLSHESDLLLRATQLVFTCLVNIAACEEKLQQWHQVIEAGEAALAMNIPTNTITTTTMSSDPITSTPFPLTQLRVKALFRCATAYEKLDELEKAVSVCSQHAGVV